jgi:hypothetical protein
MSDSTENDQQGGTMPNSDVVQGYFKQKFQYDEEKRLISEAQRDWEKEFMKDNPEMAAKKKELAVAYSAYKKNLDMDVVSEFFEDICDITGRGKEDY